MDAACCIIRCALFCPDEHAEAGASQKEQREEQGRQQREADALKQQQKLRKRKEKKKERRQSLAANTATPRLSHVTQADAGALPLFPEQKTDTQVLVLADLYLGSTTQQHHTAAPHSPPYHICCTVYLLNKPSRNKA